MVTALSVGELEATLRLRDELSAQVKAVQNNLGGLSSTVATIGRAVGISFSAGAVIAFGRAILNDADALVKLHDKTALSLGALAELRRVSIDSGSSVEGMASAINILQRNIGNENSGAVGAIRALGLNFDNLKRLSPEEQFFAVAKALRGVTDQATLVSLGTAMMGRGFMESIPAIKQGFREIDNSAAQTMMALDELGDAFGRMWQKAKDVGGTGIAGVFLSTKGRMEELSASLYALTGGWVGSSKEADVLATIQQKLAGIIPNIAAGVKDLTLSETEQANIERVLGEQLTEHAAALKEIDKAQQELAETIKAHWEDVGVIIDRVFGVDALAAANNWIDAIEAMGGSLDQLSNEHLAELNDAMLAGIDALARTGNLTDAQSSKYAALAVQAQQLKAATTAVTAEYVDALYDEAVAQDAAYAALLRANSELAKVPELKKQAAGEGVLTGEGIPAVGFTVGPGGRLQNKNQESSLGTPFGAFSIPFGSMPDIGGRNNVNVNVSGMLLSSDPTARKQLADAINRAVMEALRIQGQRMPTGA